MPDITPGKEEQFRRLQRSLAISDWVDRVIESTEPPAENAPVVLPAALRYAPPSRSLRARLASYVARLALSLDGEAARHAVTR